MKTFLCFLITFIFVISQKPFLANNSDSLLMSLQLLNKYSKDSYYLATRALKKKHQIDGESYTTDTFDSYLDSSSKSALLFSIATAVHEACHLYTDIEALRIHAQHQKNQAEKNFYYYYVGDSKAVFVEGTSQFSVGRIAATVPKKLQGLNYIYLMPKVENESEMQFEGVYGLLDEMNAYYWGSRATFDMYPAYVHKHYSDGVVEYLNHLSAYIAILEFRYYILSYMLYAEKYEPSMYESIINNGSFKKAFTHVDSNCSTLMTQYFNRISKIQLRLKHNKINMNDDGEYYVLQFPDSTSLKVSSNTRLYLDLINTMNNPLYLQQLNRLSVKTKYPSLVGTIIDKKPIN